MGNGAKTILEQKVDAHAAFAREGATLATVEELLRLDPPLHLFARYALEEAEFAGVRLRKGEKIGLLLGAANRDSARFPNPDVFEPARTPNAHVSFGAGIHFCVGAPLARLELAVALPILFARLPGLRWAGAPRYRDAFHFHGLEALRVEWA
jgi:cytochrome P450